MSFRAASAPPAGRFSSFTIAPISPLSEAGCADTAASPATDSKRVRAHIAFLVFAIRMVDSLLRF